MYILYEQAREPYLSYRPARPHRLAELIPWNRFLGSLDVCKFGLSGLLVSVGFGSLLCNRRKGTIKFRKLAIFSPKKIVVRLAKIYIFQILQSPLIPELASMANDMELIVGALRDAHLDKVSTSPS